MNLTRFTIKFVTEVMLDLFYEYIFRPLDDQSVAAARFGLKSIRCLFPGLLPIALGL